MEVETVSCMKGQSRGGDPVRRDEAAILPDTCPLQRCYGREQVLCLPFVLSLSKHERPGRQFVRPSTRSGRTDNDKLTHDRVMTRTLLPDENHSREFGVPGRRR